MHKVHSVTLSVCLPSVWTILLTQAMSHIPVLATTGRPVLATCTSRPRWLLSPDPTWVLQHIFIFGHCYLFQRN